MKKRTWQKAAALIACAAMIITTPDISNLVNVSGSSYEDETTGVEFISNEAEDVEAVSEDEDGFSGTEISDENQTTDTDFSAFDADTDTAEFVSDFSSGTDEGTDSAMITDTETEVQPAATVILESADAPQASAAVQGQPRWVHITSNASSTRQGKARIRLYMTDDQDDSPAYILYTSLFSQWQETVPEQEPSSGAVTLPPTKLEGALNGTDVLSVSRVQEYLKDDNGEYVLDDNGNLITTACYLEYELASGSSADFYAAFVYKTQDESYSYKADLKASVTWEEEEQSQDVTLPDDTGKITLTWDSSAEASGDTISADPEVADNQEDETSGEESQEQPSLVRISMTKTLEAGCQDVAEDASDTEVEDVSDENTDSADENTENTSAESEIALSGQLYGVHVTAQDLHTDATADSTIKLDLKDMGSGLPVSGLFVSMGKTEEEALSSEASDSSVIPNGLTDGDLTVTRVQNDSEDYLTFQLPAGDTADFYVGISYHAQEETYHKTIGIEPEALQETSLQDVDAQQEADPQNIEEQQSATNAELDVLSALPGAIPVESETADVQDETSQDPESQEDTDGDAGEDTGKQLISVLESGAAAITLAWADNTTPSTGMVYFAAPADWISSGYTVKVWTQANQSDTNGTLTVMTDTKASYDGMKVYALEVTSAIKPYAGLYTLLFQSFNAEDKYNTELEPFRKQWMDESVFLNKLYNSATKTWVEYTPFNPNDHTSFKGKTMYFENKTGQALSGVNAVFYEKDSSGTLQQVQSVPMQENANNKPNGYFVTIPDDACSYVQFIDASSGNVLGDTYSNFYGQGVGEAGVESVLFAEGSTDCYKYAGTAEDSTWGVLGCRTVYFDATYSKLSYKGSAGAAYSIPAEDGTFKYYISGDGKEAIEGDMTLVSSHSENGHTWKDVYRAELPEGYTNIAFFGFDPSGATNFGEHGESTSTLTIPTDLVNPCFYADAGDTVVYDGGQRDGYWDEVYTIRNAEAKKSKDVVDIAQDNFTRASDTLYVNSTFYDYYTDYELNGNNRDNYPGVNGTSYRNWVTYREFDQALSDYYQANTSSIPIYVGHFQPSYSDWGYRFSGIASTLNLYGYDDNYNNFFSTNNSALDINGTNNNDYARIAKGLVKDTLADGNLVATKEGSILPLFNEVFLLGNNSKNAVIGDVYHNVAFPFKQEDLDNNGVKYWVFDSSKTTLLMRQDSATGEYHLQDPGKLYENCTNLNSSSAPQDKHGFFPFNEGSASKSANTYNYGFGAKLEFNFRLTEDGKVTDKNGNKVPIEFNFSGDDDVWVFIDGKLALDVGGAHSPATGKLDFSTLTATVSDVKASAGDGSPTKETKFELNGKKTAEHTLTMFYMERGMWESNMKVTFNFPDENQLQVEKQVDTTGVNSLFSDLFKDTSIFNFSIKNLATHYGERKVTSDAAKPLRIAEQSYNVAPIHKDNIFAKVDSGDSNLTGSVHWYAKEDDADSSYRDQRYGELTLNSTVDISKMAYLEIKFYYDYMDTPSLSNMYLQFVDSSGKIGGNLGTDTLSGRTYGAVSMKSKEWVTVKLDLSKMSWSGFDKTKLSQIRFGYNYPRNFYLKDFVFRPTVEISEPTGFVTKQYEIPDYDSARSGKLEIPEGATYTSTSTKRDARVIGDDGEFVLEDHETITFKDQFRRGSYISLKEEVDSDLFDTTWTMYENGQAVAGMGTGTTVTNASSIPGMTKHTGTAIDDGRTEAKLTGPDADGKEQANAYDGTKPTESTFVFRSYANPDNTTTATKLKAVFYNKVKTGTLKIIKTAAEGSDSLSGSYKFRVTFTNVGDLGLEESPIVVDDITITLDATQQTGSYEITGIPVGTFFKVEEISTDDDSTLDSIVIDKTEQPKGTTAAKGDIKSSGTTVETTFRNTKKPVVNISVKKLWENADGSDYTGDLPEKIYVQLQRRQPDTVTWASVDTYKELAGNMYTGKWQTSFTGLDKYVDYKSNPQIEWQYRVVEVSVGTDGSVTPIDESGNTIQLSEGRFAVTYDKDKITGEEIITNTYQLPKTRIQILKIQAGTSESDVVKLAGATFRLEKLLDNGSVDSSFETLEAITSAETESLGLAAFEDLEDGTYQITEIQAPEGYSLLASPIKVVLNRKGNSILVDNQDVSGKLQGDTITIQVADQKKFNLPATGSWSRLILGFSGGILIGLAVIIYLLQKRRKEGKAS
ncbi:MAG: SpaA isopeptide-forming pilin-related protein [Blautia sp.]|nr:SpaA isopeptide-forming pilin-related protein [Blautia sp.]